jgi:hypothetical protein
VVRASFFPLLLLPLVAHAGDFKAGARLWLGPGVDTNAKREFVLSKATEADGFLFGVGQLDGSFQAGSWFRAVGSYDVAGRKFLSQRSEDTVVQAARLEGSLLFLGRFGVALVGRARDRRGAERDYTDLQGGIALDFFPDSSVDVRLNLNAHRFLYYNRFSYSFFGPDGGGLARYRFNRQHAISVNGAFNLRIYNAHALARPDLDGAAPDTARARQDSVFSAGLAYSYRGPFHFTFSYSYFDQTSNSFGESLKRHRLCATFGFRLPFSVTLLSSLTWQPSLFPDGVYLSSDLTLAEDDETMSSVTLKLVRPLTTWLDVDLRYAGFLGALPQAEFLYTRHVVSFGLAATF